MCQAYHCTPSQLDGEDVERCMDQQSLLSYARTHDAMHAKDKDSRPQEGPAVDLYYEVKEKLGEMVRAGEV
jgi:hypothetical protein